MTKNIIKNRSHRPFEKLLAKPPPPFPDGWFCFGLSQDFKKGVVVTKHFFGQDIVAFRNESGKVILLDPHCPHLGAHLGKGGVVEGDDIRCPFHGFCFGPEGDCTKTGYDSEPPKSARIKSWPVREKNGMILIYYSANNQNPEWEIPDFDMDSWQPLSTHEWTLDCHIQDIAENSVDLGHFLYIHDYADSAIVSKPDVQGPVLSVTYDIERSKGFFMAPTISSRLKIEVHGLGYSSVDVYVNNFRFKVRNYVLATPINDKQSSLRIALCIEKQMPAGNLSFLLKLFPKTFINPLLQKFFFKEYRLDVSQDIDIWNNKIHLEKPELAKGDGPINLYRKFTKRFYPSLDPKNNKYLYLSEQKIKPERRLETV